MKLAAHVSIRRKAGPPARGRQSTRRCWQRLPVALACASLCTTALPAILDWTGTRPVLLASGDFGHGYTTMEFQYGLDWQGFCNAHPTATCTNITYWGVGGNWSGGALPTFADDVRTPVGSLVVVGSYSSQYHGYIQGFGTAKFLSAQGTLAIGLGSSMLLGSADINDLRFSGLLQSDGRINITSISGDNGRITGAGTTFVQSIASPSFSVEVRQTQRFSLGAAFEGRLSLYGFEQAALDNTGHLSTKANNEFSVFLGGSSNFENHGTLSAINEVGAFHHNGASIPGVSNHVHNTGLVEGAFTFDGGVRFDNDGTVRLQRSLLRAGSASATTEDLSSFLALGGGTHIGVFQADAGTLLGFNGSFAAGHVFLPDSNIQSAGVVIFGKGIASVQGGYSAADTVIGTGAASVTFSGDQASFGTLTVNGFSDVTFSGHQASFGSVSVNSNGSATFTTAAPVFIPVLNLAGSARFSTQLASTVQTAHVGVGGNLASAAPLVVTGLLDLDGGTVSYVDVQGAFRWASGALGGGSVIRGANTWVNGSRSLFGDVTAETDTLWQGGNFTYWSNTYLNPFGKTVDLQGDFGIAGGGGRFDNRGTLHKSAGDGVANLNIAFDNSGSVLVDSGTLVLGGGRQAGSLRAAQGARIVLGGNTDITPLLVKQGRIDVNANTMRVLDGASYINAADASFLVQSVLTVSRSGTFVNNGVGAGVGRLDIAAGGTCPTDCGFAFNAGTLQVGSLNNGGTLVNGAGATLGLSGGFFGGNGVVLPGATIENRGTLQLQNMRLANQGTLTNRADFSVDADSFLTSTGVISNQSQFTNDGSLILTGSNRFDNAGGFNNAGGVLIDTNASFSGIGHYRQTDGKTTVDGLLQSINDIVIDGGVLNGNATVQGNVVVGPNGSIRPGHSPGLLTVDGNVTFAGTSALPGASANLEIEVASATSFDTLRVTGAATLNQAVVEFRFLAGYTPKDGDNITWLRAGSIVDDCGSTNGSACLNFRVTGLGADWDAAVVRHGGQLRLEVINEPAALDPSTQIAAGNALTIGAGQVASNWEEQPYAIELRTLDNSGAFYNRPNAWLAVYDHLYNRASGVISNRGFMQTGDTLNDGVLRIRPDAEFINFNTFTNTGEVANHGRLQANQVLNTGSGRFDNSGTLQTYALTNGSAASFDNPGLLDLPVNAAVRNEGRFTVTGTVLGGNEILNAGGTFSVSSTGVVQGLAHYRDVQGLTQVDGRLQAASITLDRGRLQGLGTLAGATTFLGEKVALPAAPGLLTIEGDLSLGQYFGFYEVELASGNLYTGLHVTGKVHVLNAVQVQFLLIGGYLPQIGDSFDWMAADGGFDGAAITSIGIYSLQVVNGQSQYTGWTAPAGVQVSFANGHLGFAAAVPEPSTWLLWLVGGIAVLSVARRRVGRG